MKIIGLTVCTLVLLLSLKCSAQGKGKRFGFELSGGYSLATRNIDDATLKAGLGFEGIFHYRFMPHTGVYAGWGWNNFSSEKSFAGNNMDFTETGYVFGLQFQHPIGNAPVSYYLRVGGLYNHIEIENGGGDIIRDTKHGLGWQFAGGVDIPIGSNWSLTPGVKFNALSRKIEIEGNSKQLDLQYFSIRLGILKKF